nr:integrase, catalytic region, zinc finger, CCHC-type, peptidase aspartic, catalytic [Tanacetum cinerariifolium]
MDILLGWDEAVMSTQEYMQKVVDDVDEDGDFNSEAWVSATNYVNAFGSTITGCLKPDISFLHVFGALCYPKNDREDIGKLGAKGDIGFFIGYSADSCAYRI